MHLLTKGTRVRVRWETGIIETGTIHYVFPEGNTYELRLDDNTYCIARPCDVVRVYV